MRNLLRIFVFTIFSIFATSCFAGGPASAVFTDVTTNSNNRDTTFTIGLRFEFGDIKRTSLVGTVRSTETDTNNDVTGALADVAIPILIDNELPDYAAGEGNPTVRALGILGNLDIQGQAGFGYDFSKNKALFALGAQGRYIDGGLHIENDGVSIPFIGVSTYEGPPSHKETTTSVCVSQCSSNN